MKNRGLAQIPLMIILLLMAVAVPVATKLVQRSADTRNLATHDTCVAGVLNTFGCGKQGLVTVSGCPTNVYFNCLPGQFSKVTRSASCACSAVCVNDTACATEQCLATDMGKCSCTTLQKDDAGIGTWHRNGDCTFTCKNCPIPTATPMPSVTPKPSPTGGAGKVPVGGTCTWDSECVAGATCEFVSGLNKQCVDPTGNTGTKKKGGEICSVNTDCNSGECTFGHCELLTSGQKCSFPAQCVSGSCPDSIHGGQCAGSQSGCSCGSGSGNKAAGSDCAANPECASGKCTFSHCEKLSIGQQCSLNPQCASGTCFESKCTTGGSLGGGSSCTVNSQCVSGKCTFQHCEKLSIGQQCLLDSQCGSGSCTAVSGATKQCVDPTGNTGTKKKGGEICSVNTDCNSGECTFGHCELLTSGQKCSFPAQCVSGSCPDSIHGGQCAGSQSGCSCGSGSGNKAAGSDCAANPECASGKCTFSHCEKLSIGQQCSLNPQCASGACVGFKCVTSGLAGGAVCTDNDQCTSKECTFGHCELLTSGQKCSFPAQCVSGSCPDSIHGGQCAGSQSGCSCGSGSGNKAAGSDCAANPECASGKCTFSHCEKLTSGQACSSGVQCASGGCQNKKTGLNCFGDISGTLCACGSGTTLKPGGAACQANTECLSNECTFGHCELLTSGQKCSFSSQCANDDCAHKITGNECWGDQINCTCKIGTIPPAVTLAPISTVKPGECVKPQVCVSLGICRGEKGTVGKSCGTNLTNVCCTFPVEPTPTAKPTVGPCQHDNQCSGPCAYCANGQCISGCTTPTFGPTVRPTVGPGMPTSVVPTSPVETIVPGTCKECPRDFVCYKNGGEFKWFVGGYVMDGFVRYIPENVADPCGGVPKPTFKGKGKGDADCNGFIDNIDFSQWHKEFFDGDKGAIVKPNYWNADFTGPEGKCDGRVDTYDFSLWQKYFSELKNGGQ